MKQLTTFCFLIISQFLGAQQYQGLQVLENLGRFSPNGGILQSSGLVLDPDQIHFWTHNDQGHPTTKLYKFAPGSGTVNQTTLDSIELAGTTNLDWEDITADVSGNIYICQIGKNCNSLSDPLECPSRFIYKVHKTSFNALNSASPGGSVLPETFYFKYPLTGYNLTNCDGNDTVFVNSEAAFWFNGQLYILTKNIWSKPTNNCGGWTNSYTYLFKVDLESGSSMSNPLIAEFVDGFDLKHYPEDGNQQTQVTGAALSPDGKVLAVLTYARLWQFRNFSGDHFFNGNASFTDHSSTPNTPVIRGYEGVEFMTNRYVILGVDGNNGRISGMDLDAPVSWIRSTLDSGPGSLRACMASVGPGDTIRPHSQIMDQPLEFNTVPLEPHSHAIIKGVSTAHPIIIQSEIDQPTFLIPNNTSLELENVNIHAPTNMIQPVITNTGTVKFTNSNILVTQNTGLQYFNNQGNATIEGECNFILVD